MLHPHRDRILRRPPGIPLRLARHRCGFRLQPQCKIVRRAKRAVGTSARHSIRAVVSIPPRCSIDTQIGTPCIAWRVATCVFQFLECRQHTLLTAQVSHLHRQPANVVEQRILVPRHGIGFFRLRQRATDLAFKRVRRNRFRCGKQRPRGAIVRLVFRRLDNLRRRERMNLVVRLHQFLFQIEEDLGEARLFLGQRKDRLIHDL